MYVADKDYIKGKYKLHMLRDIENLVAESVEIQVPFNNYITGYCAFTHKAGIHAKAILNNPSTYEILKPEDFGYGIFSNLRISFSIRLPKFSSKFNHSPQFQSMTRYVSIGHRLTGWNAVKNRCEQLGLHLIDEQVLLIFI